MLKLEISGEINGPVEEVFASLTDPANVPEWNTAVLECSSEPPGQPRVGRKFHIVSGILGRRFGSPAEVTELVPNRKLVQMTNSPFPLEWAYLTEPTAGGTKVSLEGIAEPAGFFKLAGPALRRITKKQLQAQLDTLKELLEARQPAQDRNEPEP